MQAKLEPVEKVHLNNIRLYELYHRLGQAGAENVISRAVEELAIRLSTVSRAYEQGDLRQVAKISRSIIAIADQVGMPALGVVAADVEGLTHRRDNAALAATIARLNRLGEKFLMAVWDMQDVSV